MWQWALGCLLLVVLLLILAITFPMWRRHRISVVSGTFDLAVKFASETGPDDWKLGIARYGEDELEWFATFGFRLSPRYRLRRESIDVDSHSRSPYSGEASALHGGSVIVACRTQAGIRQLALTPHALTGLLAWLEASPPGRRVNNVL